MKPGWKTTEFWLTIFANMAGLAAAIAEVLPPDKAGILIVVANGLYALSRGVAKKG